MMASPPHSTSSVRTCEEPRSSQGEDDTLCAMMKDLLITGLTTRDDLLAFGFTEAELAAAVPPLSAGPSAAPVGVEATPPAQKPAHSVSWTPQTQPARSALESITPDTARTRRTRPREDVDTPVPVVCNEEDRSVDESACRAGGASASAPSAASGTHNAWVDGPPPTHEPLTETKRVARQRDAEHAQRFSDHLACANASAASPAARALFGGASPPTKPNSALRFTVEDAMAAKETSRLLAHDLTAGADDRSFDEFVAERALLCEDCM